MTSIQILEQLEEALSLPSERDIEFMRTLEGDVMVLGAGGKMGPSLVRLCQRAAEAAGRPRRIIAITRRECDLTDRSQVAHLPDCENVLYLAGRKFGSTGNPELTWAMNTVVPGIVADRFATSRIVAFSTGNVYAFRAPDEGGSRESDTPAPVGEYAQSCLGRERVFEYFANTRGLRCLLFRLNYSVDLRYGVPVDIARKVWRGEPVTLVVPAFNMIWQRDANSYALRALAHCATPAAILNVTGAETWRVRDVAQYFAQRFGRECRFEGDEGSTALLSDSSRARQLMGDPEVLGERLLEMVARWVESGGVNLDKPTHFEVSDGKF